MKVAILEYYLKHGELLGSNITSKENKVLFNQITEAAYVNSELAKKLLGKLRFEFDISNSNNPNSTFIEPNLFFKLPINNNQYTVLRSRNLTLNFCLTFPVIVPDFFESTDELNDYIFEDGIEYSCYIYSDIFKSEEWNIDFDDGFDLCAIKLSKKNYKTPPKSVLDFYSNSEIRFEYDFSV